MTLTTTLGVKNQAGINPADTSKDLQIGSLVNGVSDLVTQYLGRDICERSYTEYYSGDGRPFLMLRQYPVISVTLVCEDQTGYAGQNPTDPFDPSLNLVQGVDYMIMPGQYGVGSSGMLRRIGERGWWSQPSKRIGHLAQEWPIPRGNIKVEYTAGFATVPASIQVAVNDLVIQKLRSAAGGRMTASESYQGASASWFGPGEMDKVFGSVKQAMGRYRSIPI